MGNAVETEKDFLERIDEQHTRIMVELQALRNNTIDSMRKEILDAIAGLRSAMPHRQQSPWSPKRTQSRDTFPPDEKPKKREKIRSGGEYVTRFQKGWEKTGWC